MPRSHKYSMTFTEGTLLLEEGRRLAELYTRMKGWKAVREAALEHNVLQKSRAQTAKTIVKEVKSRLSLLSDAELSLLISGSRSDQQQVAWLAICKRYLFIEEFARDVLHEKYLRLDLELTKQDYDRFYAEKAAWEENIDNLAESTRKRLKSNLFRMMREANLLSAENAIQPAILSKDLADAIRQDGTKWFACFPVAPISIQA